jgi:hypothetical protein
MTTTPHATLSPKTNIVLIFVFASLAAFMSLRFEPFPVLLLPMGLGLGVIGGLLQLKSFREGKEGFKSAKTMLEVRRVLKSTKSGKRYIYFLWASNLMLVVVGIATSSNPGVHIFVGYFALMSAREIVTLKSTFELAKLNKTSN